MAEDIDIKKKRSQALRFLGKGKIDKAIEIYEEILKVKEDPDIYNSVGDLYVRKQNISKAIEYYEKSFKLYKEKEFYDNAVAVVRKILKYDRERKDLYLELADMYTELGNQDEALNALENVVTDEIDTTMLERAFAVITQLAEKVQEDESSIQRFERLFIKLQEISERFGEISLESGMGMESGEDIFAQEEAVGESKEVEEEEEEGLVFEDVGEKSTSPQSLRQEEKTEEEGLIFESQEGEGEVATKEEEQEPILGEEEEEIKPVQGVQKYGDFYEASETSTREVIFEGETESEPAVSQSEAEGVSLETSLPKEEVEEGVGEIKPEEREVEGSEAVSEVAESEVNVTTKSKVEEEIEQKAEKKIEIPTEEIISSRPLERQKLTTTTRYGEEESKYYEEFKDIVLTFIEEIGETDINDLYDFSHPFDTAMTLYKMELYDAAISEFQIAMRYSEYRLKSMEMIGKIFFEMNNYDMAIKMLLKALDEGGYEEHEYIGIKYYLGKSFESIGLEDKALEQYEQVYLIDRDYEDVSERIDRLRLKRVKSF